MQSAEYARMFELEDRYWWFVARRELASELIASHTQPGSVLLDVGCGTGKGQESFSQFGTVYGVDFSQEALEFSSSRGLRKITRADAQALPIQSDSIDLVVTLDTLEHVPDDVAAVREMYRVIKPGGTLVMNVPAYQWLWGPHDVALMHFRRYHRRQLRKLLTDADFEIERISYHIFLLFPLVCLSRLIGRFKKGEPSATLPTLPGWLEAMLGWTQKVEKVLFRAVNLPWGSSIVVVARKRS